MRFKKIMRRTLLYSLALIAVWLLLAQCFIMRNRWSDSKAYGVFKAKQVPLVIYDTVINKQHLHYAAAIVYLHWFSSTAARAAG